MKNCLSILTLFLVLIAVSAPARSEWSEGGLGICQQLNGQTNISMIPDGAGGAILTWRDYRGGTNFDIYAQRVDAEGNALWTADGVAVCQDSGHQYSPQIVSDGAGGAIIAWRDDRGSAPDVYAQRLDGNGTILWTVNGVPVSTATAGQYEPQICSDRSGGAIMVWKDTRNSATPDLYVQRIDQNGNQVWTTNGVAICTYSAGQYDPVIASDISGGAIIAWRDDRVGTPDIYAQRVTSQGVPVWNYDGSPICTESGIQQRPQICSDGTYGAIIVWVDSRGADLDIYAQKTDGMGFYVWTYQGIPVCAASGSQYYPEIESDGNLGAYIAWYDERGSDSDIYVQRVSGIGMAGWTSDGVPVCTAAGNQMGPVMAAVDDGLIITWKDPRDGITHVYLQKIDPAGSSLWTADGIPAASYYLGSWSQQVVTDGAGGAIVAWEHNTISNGADIFAQRIERNGYWGNPAPVISAIRDVPGDQGSYINVAWDASRLDPWPEESISEYTVWRAIDEEAALALASSGVSILEGIPSLAPENDRLIMRMESSAAGEYYWKLVSTLEAHQLESYSEVISSLFDSTAVCTEYHYIQVIAYSVTPGQYWISVPDSGYSVDNLAPAAPLGIAGEQSYTPDGLQLTWDPNSESDLASYNIYRGTSESFVPGPGNFVTSTPDTASFDDEWSWDTSYWYKVAAVDIHGNESPFAVFGPDMVTGDDPMPLPDATFLVQNFPNPFNPITTIAFGIKESGHISIRIYDAAGRLVTTLVDESRPAGSYTIEWDGRDNGGGTAASGVYFYKIVAGDFVRTRKMVLLK